MSPDTLSPQPAPAGDATAPAPAGDVTAAPPAGDTAGPAPAVDAAQPATVEGASGPAAAGDPERPTVGSDAAEPPPAGGPGAASAGDASPPAPAGEASRPPPAEASRPAPGDDAPAPEPAGAASRPPSGGDPRADCAALLKQRFPALFAGGAKPLKLRIQADIQQRAPGEFSKQALSAFLRRLTGSTGYLLAMTRSPHRHDLDGNPSGEVSAEHRQAALDELARRRALHQAKVEQAEEGRRMRASLLRDFERTTLTLPNFCALKGIAPEALDALLHTAREEASQPPPAAPHAPQRRPHRSGGGRPREAQAGAPGPKGRPRTPPG